MPDDSVNPRTLEKARRGDPAAFRALYEHHVDVVYAFLHRMLRQDAAAEDALQDVFLRVLRALPRFDPAGPARLSTWILAIARNVALDALRSAGRRERAAGGAADDGTAPGPDLRIALHDAIAALPDAQRTLFVLAEGCALSYEEMAEVEGIDVGTVRSRLHRAREALRAHLADDNGDDDGRRHVRATR